MRFKFNAAFIMPPDTTLRLNPHASVLTPENAASLLVELKQALRQDCFTITLGDHEQVGYQRVGQTAAHFSLMYEEKGQVKHFHAVVAVMPRLDANDDRETIELAKQFKVLAGIPHDMFDRALNDPTMMVAAFFTGQPSIDYPVLYDLIRLLSAAFLDQYGLGTEDDPA